MDRSPEERGPDTGKLEIKHILNFLLSNGYTFKGTRKAINEGYEYPDAAIADFSKRLEFSDTDGNYVLDGSLDISIQFEKRADYENFEKNEDEDDIYVGNPTKFIKKLIKETSEKQVSGGRSKRRTLKTKKI
uniref:Uncharacterized protein n=1 Tax=viral metagenome TaxID=1070528 RepID=A0A6C0I1Q0_9ZZZZ